MTEKATGIIHPVAFHRKRLYLWPDLAILKSLLTFAHLLK